MSRYHRADPLPDESLLARERAEQFGMMIAIHLEAGRREHCARVLVRAYAEIERSSDLAGEASIEPADVQLSELGLPIRTLNLLEKRDIFTAAAAMAASDEELRTIPNFGEKAVAELRRTLAAAFELPLQEKHAQPLAAPHQESVSRLGLAPAIVAALEAAGVFDCRRLAELSDDRLFGMRGIDRQTVETIREALAKLWPQEFGAIAEAG